jgi:hypothetical protein
MTYVTLKENQVPQRLNSHSEEQTNHLLKVIPAELHPHLLLESVQDAIDEQLLQARINIAAT